MQLSTQASENDLSRFQRIGLFDSGLGGLSVLRRLAELPGASSRSFVYIGDTARCPYGNREATEIALFVDQIVHWLLRQHVDAIVMACNTSAAMALSTAQAIANVPVFDLIEPTARVMAQCSGRIGIMATQATVSTRAFSKAIWKLSPDCDVREYACPDLVPLVESGGIASSQAERVLAGYVFRLLADQVESVVLGCTHFPFLRGQLERLAAGRIKFIDPAQILSGTFSHDAPLLYSCDLRVTGDSEAFARSARICLGDMPFAVEKIRINELEACRSDFNFALQQEAMAPPAVTTVVQ